MDKKFDSIKQMMDDAQRIADLAKHSNATNQETIKRGLLAMEKVVDDDFIADLSIYIAAMSLQDKRPIQTVIASLSSLLAKYIWASTKSESEACVVSETVANHQHALVHALWDVEGDPREAFKKDAGRRK